LLSRLIMRTSWTCYRNIDGTTGDEKKMVLDSLKRDSEDGDTYRGLVSAH
jgi:hypothetical protein